MKLLFQLIAVVLTVAVVFASMPSPFTRQLKLTSPYMTGNDVLICQTLIKRDNAVDKNLATDGVFGPASADAVSDFQKANGLKSTGILDDVSAQKLLDLHSDDKYTDSGFTAESVGYLYKFYIPVHKNRSIETDSILYDKTGKVLLKFRTRTHGHRG
jgi:peptidoglycan hydrolase-like protein with peptidoglycan-binding domain